MTSVIDSKSRIVIPAEIREQVALGPGDRVEVLTDGQTITVAKAKNRRNRGLVDLLLACPVKNFMRRRRGDYTRVKNI